MGSELGMPDAARSVLNPAQCADIVLNIPVHLARIFIIRKTKKKLTPK